MKLIFMSSVVALSVLLTGCQSKQDKALAKFRSICREIESAIDTLDGKGASDGYHRLADARKEIDDQKLEAEEKSSIELIMLGGQEFELNVMSYRLSEVGGEYSNTDAQMAEYDLKEWKRFLHEYLRKYDK